MDYPTMRELTFLVEDAPEGGYTASALGAAIFTEANDLPSLAEKISDAVLAHFEEGQEPQWIHLDLEGIQWRNL